MNKEEAMQGFDGLMLGDGGLWRGTYLTYFSMASSKKPITTENHLKWLTWIRDNILRPQGIVALTGHPRLLKRGEPSLETCGSKRLNLIWDEWYAGGEWKLSSTHMYIRSAYKKLPDSIRRGNYRLSEMDLAVWDMGDGNHDISKNMPRVGFSTNCFLPEEVAFLAWLLEDQYDLVTRRPGYDQPKFQKDIDAGRGLALLLASMSINKYIDIAEPLILEFCKDHVGPSFKDQKLRRWEREPRSYSPGVTTVHNAAHSRYEKELKRLRWGFDPVELNHPGVPVQPSLDELRRNQKAKPFENLRRKLRGG